MRSFKITASQVLAAPVLAAPVLAAAAAPLFGLLAGLSTAQAHVVLETREAQAGASYKAVLRVPHGCQGEPTTGLRVRIPDGVVSVRPQPKPGWELDTVIEAYDEPVDVGHGNVATEGVRVVSWSGGELADAHYDEFVMIMRLPNTPGETLYFPVVQDCVENEHRWIEIPEAGRDAHDYSSPAPGLHLTGGEGESHGHSHGHGHSHN